ncbi:type II toxin-antitoxin system PemK/MazF family toxin [Rhizobium sp. Root482]|uniref:type II toxin-antitoxin system PemK/MazF family toxin n=1 Tax=Rhizobium sp. Root482 TaxID=1736543 RepID=UPI0007021ECC|nr:type II toxin-antitoxin system PemK/MazF family toxin [Rhizobium sp. Root482]KQY11354.1 growth inhibitor PemK [Rhizobium sp. Root482]
MRRGDIITVAVSGDYGKPRPAVVVQTNAMNDKHDSVIVCMMTSHDTPLVDFRLALQPTPTNGLKLPSYIMVDKPVTVRQDRAGSVIGKLEPDEVRMLDSILSFVLGFSDT